MKDGNHVHNESNPQGLHKHKKLMVFGVIAIVIAIAAYDLGQTATETANINNVFEIVVNNTNLAPSIHGVPGTGERVAGMVYYTNRSPIQILVFAHATNVSQTAFVQLTINGTVVLPQSGRPLGGAEQSNRSVSAIIPKFSNYSVIIENEHHYEWREYPILSGKNGTLNIIQYINQTGNQSNVFDEIKINSISKNDTSVNDTIILNNNYACSERGFDSCYIYSSPKSNTYIRFDNTTPQIRMLVQGETFFPWSRLNIEPTVFDFTMENDEIDNYINIASRIVVHANNKNTGSSAEYILQTYNAGAGLDKERHMLFINNTDLVDIDFTNTTINNDVIISNATGSGNTFACFDPSGKLFSSLAPCVP